MKQKNIIYKTDFSEFGDEASSQGMVEIDDYLKMNIKKSIELNELGQWWQQQENIFPKLSKVARWVLAIPASSERVFSIAGIAVSQRRAAFSPGTVDAILFIHGQNNK